MAEHNRLSLLVLKQSGHAAPSPPRRLHAIQISSHVHITKTIKFQHNDRTYLFQGETIMLDQILRAARTFEDTHGLPPDIIYINPYHYEGLCRHHPELFYPNQDFRLGFRLVIVASSRLKQPEAAILPAIRHFCQVA
jgi:hypothetical protein